MKTMQDVATLLNELNKLDPVATKELVIKRVNCNEKIANHEYVTVLSKTDGVFEVGMMGVLNGLFGDTGERIIAFFDEDFNIVKFEVGKV